MENIPRPSMTAPNFVMEKFNDVPSEKWDEYRRRSLTFIRLNGDMPDADLYDGLHLIAKDCGVII